jgi:electron transfer flavoprotein alpha subunit
VQSLDPIKVITVRTTGFDAAGQGGSAALSRAWSLPWPSGHVAFLGSEIAKSDRPELTAAKIIVSGGRALGSSEKFAAC